MAELIVPPSLRESHRRGLARYVKTQQSALLNRRVELVGMRKDGTEFPIELTIARIPLEGTLAFTGCRGLDPLRPDEIRDFLSSVRSPEGPFVRLKVRLRIDSRDDIR